jgi:hypothetical protein
VTAATQATIGDRYSALAARCSESDMREVWQAVLFGRCSSLRTDLSAIANELAELRNEAGRASAARGLARAAA